MRRGRISISRELRSAVRLPTVPGQLEASRTHADSNGEPDVPCRPETSRNPMLDFVDNEITSSCPLKRVAECPEDPMLRFEEHVLSEPAGAVVGRYDGEIPLATFFEIQNPARMGRL